MEKLKSLIPENLKRTVANSKVEGLPDTSSALLHFLLNLPLFHLMVQDLADPGSGLCAKNKENALKSKENGNKCFSSGDYATALASYTKALRVAPKDAVDMGKNLVATLFLNRATLFHKMGLLIECLRDCNRSLQKSPSYAKAWYRRGKANAALKNYEDAVHDLNVAKNVELSSGGKRQIESELEMIVEQCMHISTTLASHKEINMANFGAKYRENDWLW